MSEEKTEKRIYFWQRLDEEGLASRFGWSRTGLVAESDEQAYEFLGIKGADKHFTRLRWRPYNGKRKPGSKIRPSYS